ncbi:MAG: pyruvate formate lyase family protein, partial [bacterium]
MKILMREPFSHAHDEYVGKYLASGPPKIIGIGREVVGARKDGSTFPLELALNDGCSLLTGTRVGPSTGAAAALDSMDAVREAFERQLGSAMETACAAACAAERRLAAQQPMPLFSCLMPGCMARGADTLAGGADHNFSGMCLAEVATTANSLAAIERLIFEERHMSLETLVGTLKRNFEGAEDLRQRLRQGMPKFGTDDPAVDRQAEFVARTFDTALRGRPHARGGMYLPLIFSRPHRQTLFGAKTAATADGRRSGEILAVSLNPVPGTADQGQGEVAADGGGAGH